MSGILEGMIGATATLKCDILISPTSGTTPLSVFISSTVPTAHLFYTKVTGVTGVDPTHTGDSATGITVRIGGNSGSVSTGAGEKVIRALAYSPGYLDSVIAEGDYENP